MSLELSAPDQHDAMDAVAHFCKRLPDHEDYAAFLAGKIDIDGLIRRTFSRRDGSPPAFILKP